MLLDISKILHFRQGKLFILLDDGAHALECFNKAYNLSKDDALEVVFSQNNIEFIQKTLSTRTELLEKITKIETTTIESQRIIDTFSNPEHPAFHQAVEHFLSLKQAKSELLEQCIENCSVTTDLVDTEQKLASSSESDDDDAQTAARIFRTLSDKNQALSLQLLQLEEKFATQKEEFAKILEELSAEQGELRTSIDLHEATIEEHSLSISKLNKFAETLELDQQRMNKLVQDLRSRGFHNLNETLTHFSSLKENLTLMLPEQQLEKDNVYQESFYYTLKRDLIAAQSAAMLVTSTNIISNGKTGKTGHIGDLLEIAGDVVPAFGGYIQFFGAILNTIDHQQQQQIVEKLANIAPGPIEMNHIASSVAIILSQDYLDKSLIDNRTTSLKNKIINYLRSFLEELSDNSSASHSTGDADVNRSSRMTFTSIFSKKEKSSVYKDEESTSSSKSSGFSFWSKKSVTKTTDADSSSSDADSSSSGAAASSLDFLPEEKEGRNNAHLISSIILTAIYKGNVQARIGHHQTIIQKMLEAVFLKLELDITPIPQILEKELAPKLIVDAKIVTTSDSATISPEKQIAEEMAQNILDEIKKQVQVPENFDSTFLHSMTTRLETSYSSTKTPLIKSLIESYKFKTAFTGQIVELLVAKLQEDNTIKPSLSFIRNILKATEKDLRAEDDSFTTTQSADEILVWCCDIVYDNPLLNNWKLLQEATRTLSPTDLDKFFNIGRDDPEAAELLMQNIQNYGFEHVMNMLFETAGQRDDGIEDESHEMGGIQQEETL